MVSRSKYDNTAQGQGSDLGKYEESNSGNRLNGAQKRTRTSTSIRTLAPEASASTNSAIWAQMS